MTCRLASVLLDRARRALGRGSLECSARRSAVPGLAGQIACQASGREPAHGGAEEETAGVLACPCADLREQCVDAAIFEPGRDTVGGLGALAHNTCDDRGLVLVRGGHGAHLLAGRVQCLRELRRLRVHTLAYVILHMSGGRPDLPTSLLHDVARFVLGGARHLRSLFARRLRDFFGGLRSGILWCHGASLPNVPVYNTTLEPVTTYDPRSCRALCRRPQLQDRQRHCPAVSREPLGAVASAPSSWPRVSFSPSPPAPRAMRVCAAARGFRRATLLL